MSTFFVLLLYIAQFVTCQICNETRSVLREVPETYQFSYIETYEEPCIIFCSEKTRTAVNVTTRLVKHYENVTMNVCCDGYIEDDSHEGNGLYCEPICHPECQNGFCRRPNECACNTGYALDPLNSHVCKPLCLQDCNIPNCISIQNPQCFSNITKQTNPVCTPPCINAICIAPDICKCLPGFEETSENNCEPQGISSRVCDEGWQWKPAACEPKCFGCEFGTCIGPQECECNEGYIKSVIGNCEPYCSSGCPNGKCVSPEVCSCNSGWYKVSDDGDCVSHCDIDCENDNCNVRNTTFCFNGNDLDINKENLIHTRKDCEGISATLNDCKCELPYEVGYSTVDGTDCDCFVNCSDTNRNCTKSFCVYMNQDANLNELEDAVKLPDINVVPLQKLHDSIVEYSSTEKNKLVQTDTYSKFGFKKLKDVSVYWIYGVVAVLVLIMLLILRIVIKKKCCKSRHLKSPDTINDVIVHYKTNT